MYVLPLYPIVHNIRATRKTKPGSHCNRLMFAYSWLASVFALRAVWCHLLMFWCDWAIKLHWRPLQAVVLIPAESRTMLDRRNSLVVSSVRRLVDRQVSADAGQVGVRSVVQQQPNAGGVP